METALAVETMTENEMKVFAVMETVAQRHGIKLVCVRCNKPFQGVNGIRDYIHSIFCGCREIKSKAGSQIIRI